MYKVKIFGR